MARRRAKSKASATQKPVNPPGEETPRDEELDAIADEVTEEDFTVDTPETPSEPRPNVNLTEGEEESESVTVPTEEPPIVPETPSETSRWEVQVRRRELVSDNYKRSDGSVDLVALNKLANSNGEVAPPTIPGCMVVERRR